jgi:hypothetical protein
MRRDPSQKQESLVEVAALKYFTNREGAIEAFERYLNAPAGTDLRVLTFYGVGGIGKTTLINKLCDNLRHAKIPHARFDLQTVRDPDPGVPRGAAPDALRFGEPVWHPVPTIRPVPRSDFGS